MPESSSPEITPFVNKTVPFRFAGRDLQFRLSHALFSSFDIDDGTRLLLKSLAQRLDLGSVRDVLDVGCGVGVIGACIAAAAPSARVVLQDRDALAVAFTRENCRLNGLPRATAECRLAFQGLAGGSFDLVTSNLPAKAGSPVLVGMLRHAAGCLRPTGVAAVVIVAPLAALARQAIADMGARLQYAEDGPGHSVFHFSAGSVAPDPAVLPEDLAPYLRGRWSFERHGVRYTLQTAWSLPDFDTLGRDIELALDLMRDDVQPDRAQCAAAFWNPGQGHLPAALLARYGSACSVTLAARDCLECRISGLNLAAAGREVPPPLLLCSELDLGNAFSEASLDFLAAVPHPIPRAPWQPGLARSAFRVLRPGGTLLVVASSTEMYRFLQRCPGLALVSSRKKAGFRAALLRRTAAAIPP